MLARGLALLALAPVPVAPMAIVHVSAMAQALVSQLMQARRLALLALARVQVSAMPLVLVSATPLALVSVLMGLARGLALV